VAAEPRSLHEHVNWLTYSHQQLYDMVNNGVNLTAAGTVSDSWARLAESLKIIGDHLDTALTASADGWQGASADAARNAIRGLVGWAHTTGGNAMAMSGCLQQQVHNVQTARVMRQLQTSSAAVYGTVPQFAAPGNPVAAPGQPPVTPPPDTPARGPRTGDPSGPTGLPRAFGGAPATPEPEPGRGPVTGGIAEESARGLPASESAGTGRSTGGPAGMGGLGSAAGAGQGTQGAQVSGGGPGHLRGRPDHHPARDRRVMRNPDSGWFRLSATEFRVLWRAAGLPGPPTALAIPEFGRPAADLAELLELLGGRAPGERGFTLLANRSDDQLRAYGVINRDRAALLSAAGEEVRLGPLWPGTMTDVLLDTLDPLPAGAGRPANVSWAVYREACAQGETHGTEAFLGVLRAAGLRPPEAHTLLRAVTGRSGGGELELTARDAHGTPLRPLSALTWIDTGSGRYAVRLRDDWLTVTPAHRARLGAMVTG